MSGIGMELERDIAVAICRGGCHRTQVSPAFAVAGSIAGIVGVEVDIELVADGRVKRSVNGLRGSSRQR